MPSRLQGKTVLSSPAVGLPKEAPPNQSFRQSLKRKQSKPKKISRPALGDNHFKSHTSARPFISMKASVCLRLYSKRRLPNPPVCAECCQVHHNHHEREEVQPHQ